MREWIDELSEWMQNQEKIESPLTDLVEEVHQTSLETDSLLQASDQLQSAYSSIIGKIEHVSS